MFINDANETFTPDGAIHEVGFIGRHPCHGTRAYTDFSLSPGTPFVRAYRNPDLTGGYWVAYPSELTMSAVHAAG